MIQVRSFKYPPHVGAKSKVSAPKSFSPQLGAKEQELQQALHKQERYQQCVQDVTAKMERAQHKLSRGFPTSLSDLDRQLNDYRLSTYMYSYRGGGWNKKWENIGCLLDTMRMGIFCKHNSLWLQFSCSYMHIKRLKYFWSCERVLNTWYHWWKSLSFFLTLRFMDYIIADHVLKK